MTPLMYRIMEPDGEHPKVGSDRNMLGVRPGAPPSGDIPVDEDGDVHPGTGGLSVSPDWKKIHLAVIPKRFNKVILHARGTNRNAIWKMGENSFEEGPIGDALCLKPDSPRHGVIEPDTTTALERYQVQLGQTRDEWTEVPVPGNQP